MRVTKILRLIFFIVIISGPLAAKTEFKSNKAITNIKADYLKFNSKKKKTLFYGNVVLTQPAITLKADSIISYENNKIVEAYGKVYYNNSKDSVEATGKEAEYWQDTQYIVLKGDAYIKIIKDTLTIKADRIDFYTKKSIAKFYDNVRINKKELSATCGYAVYSDTGKKFVLYDSPVVIRNADRFASDTIVVYINSKEVEMLGNVHGKLYQTKPKPGVK